MATMVTAAVTSIAVLTGSGRHAGMRDVIGAVLVGAVAGVPAAAGIGWLARQ
jgi:hypothetical protein